MANWWRDYLINGGPEFSSWVEGETSLAEDLITDVIVEIIFSLGKVTGSA